MAGEINVYRIEYEKVPSMSSWTTFIAAHSVEEAESYVHSLVGPMRTSTIGIQCRLDGISYQFRDKILNAYADKKIEKKISKEIKFDENAAPIGENKPEQEKKPVTRHTANKNVKIGK